MSEKDKEYAEYLKTATKEYIDGIKPDNSFDFKILKLIYGFAQSGFRESEAQKGNEISSSPCNKITLASQ